jgi:predicted AAA+ superfamily ATPase
MNVISCGERLFRLDTINSDEAEHLISKITKSDHNVYATCEDKLMSEQEIVDAVNKNEKKMIDKKMTDLPANFIPGLTKDKILKQIHELKTGDYKRVFKHNIRYKKLNMDQRLGYLVMATHLLLETGQHIIVLGKAGVGKSMSVRKLLNDYPERILVSTPFGLLAAA